MNEEMIGLLNWRNDYKLMNQLKNREKNATAFIDSLEDKDLKHITIIASEGVNLVNRLLVEHRLWEHFICTTPELLGKGNRLARKMNTVFGIKGTADTRNTVNVYDYGQFGDIAGHTYKAQMKNFQDDIIELEAKQENTVNCDYENEVTVSEIMLNNIPHIKLQSKGKETITMVDNRFVDNLKQEIHIRDEALDYNDHIFKTMSVIVGYLFILLILTNLGPLTLMNMATSYLFGTNIVVAIIFKILNLIILIGGVVMTAYYTLSILNVLY